MMVDSLVDLDGWDEVVSRLGGEAALSASAFAHGALVRKREVRSAGALLRLAMLYAPGGHSLRMSAALAEMSGIASLSDVGLLRRLLRCGDWLEHLCSERLGLVARAPPGKAAGRRLRIRDATSILSPGKGGRHMLHLNYDPQSARIVDFVVTQAPSGESMGRLATQDGDLIIADRAYPRPQAIADIRATGGEILLRLTWNSLRVAGEDGVLLDWNTLLQEAGHAGIDRPVMVLSKRKGFTPVPLRLVIQPLPEAKVETARLKAKRASAKKQSKTHDPRTQTAAGYLILLTSLPQHEAPPERLKDLYALRWQIEIAFKRMKSILDFGKLPAKHPKLVRTWLFAHLLLALLLDDIRTAADAIPP